MKTTTRPTQTPVTIDTEPVDLVTEAARVLAAAEGTLAGVNTKIDDQDLTTEVLRRRFPRNEVSLNSPPDERSPMLSRGRHDA